MNGAKFEFDWDFNQSNWNFNQSKGKFYVIISRAASTSGATCLEGSYRYWKTWKNETTFSSEGKVRELCKNVKKSGTSYVILYFNFDKYTASWFLSL